MEKFTEEERDEQLALYECLKDAQTELECTIERMKGKYAVLKRGIQKEYKQYSFFMPFLSLFKLIYCVNSMVIL